MGRREGTALGGPGVGGRNRRIVGFCLLASQAKARSTGRGVGDAESDREHDRGRWNRLPSRVRDHRGPAVVVFVLQLAIPIAKTFRIFSEIIAGDPYKGHARVMSQPFLKRQGSSNTILTERILNRGSRFDSVNYRSCDRLPLVCTARRRKRKEKAARNNRENSVCGNNRCMP